MQTLLILEATYMIHKLLMHLSPCGVPTQGENLLCSPHSAPTLSGGALY